MLLAMKIVNFETKGGNTWQSIVSFFTGDYTHC